MTKSEAIIKDILYFLQGITNNETEDWEDENGAGVLDHNEEIIQLTRSLVFRTNIGLEIYHWDGEIIPEHKEYKVNVTDEDIEFTDLHDNSDNQNVLLQIFIAAHKIKDSANRTITDLYRFLRDAEADVKLLFGSPIFTNWFLEKYDDVEFTLVRVSREIDKSSKFYGESRIYIEIDFNELPWGVGEPDYS